MDISNNLNIVDKRISDALKAAKREKDDITLVGVTKNVEIPIIRDAIKEGLVHIGENRAQEFVDKYDKIDSAKWHFIGSLQRNKVKYIIDKVFMIHSLDRLSLAKEINKQALKVDRIMHVLVQINIADENTKYGLPYEEAIPFIETLFNLKNIKVKGLMAMAPLVDNPEKVRPYFRLMKRLFDELKTINYPHIDMQYLSMGMTNDFEVAISEGSNLVRIGRAIFK